MTYYSPWLNVPQAVVLEARHDIERALGLTSESPALLILKVNQLVARTVIPPEVNAGEEQWQVDFKTLDEAKEEAKTAIRANSRYLEAQQRVLWRLVAGVRTKARRRPGGPYEDVDPVEYTGVELQGLDAIDKTARTLILFDLLINVYEYIESLTGKPVRLAGVSCRQLQGRASPELEKWDSAGDPVPKVIDWARSKWGGDIENLPARSELLQIFRGQFGRVRGISELTMREVRRQLAPDAARRGGAPRHRR